MTKPREESAIHLQNFCWKCHNGEYMFADDYVKTLFLEAVDRALSKYDKVKIPAYAIMSNHVHFIIRGKLSDITLFTKSVGASFGKKYHEYTHTTGEIFERRYYSKPINDMNFFLYAMAYVFNNPVKAGMVKMPQQYLYSNFHNIHSGNYLSQFNNIVDSRVYEGIKETEIVEFTLDRADELHKFDLELYPKDRIYDYEVRAKLCELAGDKLTSVRLQSKEFLSDVVSKLLDFGANVFQIGRVTGLGDYKVRSLARQLE